MDRTTFLAIIQRAQTAQANLVKKADPLTTNFADAVQTAQNNQLRSEALGDVRNLFLASLGAGLAGRGGIGLINQLMRSRPKKQKTGPAHLPLAYPVEPKIASWASDFGFGLNATSKAGIPWYTPAMFASGLAGIGAGWKGLDAILERRRSTERENELNQAREQFRDALLDQYAQPVPTHPGLIKSPRKTAADVSEMTKVGAALDAVWQKVAPALADTQAKQALDLSNAAGALAGGYGAYAGLAGLLSGAFVYDKMRKRSRGAILDKAMQRRRRREFTQRPTEIFATPEPTLSSGQPAVLES